MRSVLRGRVLVSGRGRLRRRLALAALATCGLASSACGGAKEPARSPGEARGAGAPAGDTSIGDSAVAQGGLAGLASTGIGGGDGASLAGALRADLVDQPVKLDGLLSEWPARTAAEAVSGSPSATLQAGIQYDDAKLYVAGEIGDPSFAFGKDHATLVLAIPGAAGALAVHEVGLYPGKPGETGGAVKGAHGEEIAGAKIVEAPIGGGRARDANGVSFEAVVPWTAFAEARLVRVGLRGFVRYAKADGVVATGRGDPAAPATLPAIPTEPEQSLIDGLLRPRGLEGKAPRADVYADVAGDERKERIAVFDRFFTVCGPGFRGGREFFYRDLGAEVRALEARDVTGRGKSDIVIRRRFPPRGDGGAQREWFEIWSILQGDEPASVFAHEIAVSSGAKHVTNSVHLTNKEVEIATEPAVGWDASTYREPAPSDVLAVLLPWGGVRSQTFRFESGRFVKTREAAQSAAPAAQAPPPPAAPAPAPAITETRRETARPESARGGDPSSRLLDQYRRDHAAGDVVPRFDLQAQIEGDARPERVVLVGRDLVVFGPGFKGGNAYAFITLAQFAEPNDVKELTARDVDGDGASELVVRGVRHITVSGAATDMEAMFVYQVKASAIARVFGIETAREQSGKRVQGAVQLVPARSGKGLDIDVRPGRATGWTEKTYPWQEEAPGSGALEPLLLPWGKTRELRYVWSGAGFALATSASPKGP